jgi:penicillin-binding protein 2
MGYGLKDFTKRFSRRMLVLGGAKGALGILLGVRMYQLQIRDGEKFFELAEGNRIDVRYILPVRGRIVTSDGVAVADNKPKFSLDLVPYRVRSADALDESLKILQEITPITAEELAEIREMNKRSHRAAIVPIKEFTDDWQTLSQLSAHLHRLNGIDINVTSLRSYPYPEMMSGITGYVGSVNKKEQSESTNPIFKAPNMKIGKNGVEKTANDSLIGLPGENKLEVNHVGSVIRELERKEPSQGEDVRLTINHELQKVAFEKLGEESGAVTVMNVRNGAVMCMASAPGYNPNKFVNGISFKDWAELRDNEKAPMNNKAIMGMYPPGSTFKMLTALAALEAGVIDEKTRVHCPGHFNLGNARFHCWKYSGHGSVNVTRAIMQSCDVFFYEVALRAGIEKIAEICRKFGLGSPTGIELIYEKAGLVPSPEWKKERFGLPWVKGDTVNSAIGQGSVLTTPLQLAVMAARLATGKAVLPRILENDLPIKPYTDIDVSPKNLGLVQQGMFEVVNAPGGTALGARLDHPFAKMAGKTGTAQVRRITAAERARGVFKNEQLPWKFRDHALFVGFAPHDNPIFAASAVVEHGSAGSKVAAPMVKAALDKMLEIHYRTNTYGPQPAPEKKEG